MSKIHPPDVADAEMPPPNSRHRRPLQQTTIPLTWGQLKNLCDKGEVVLPMTHKSVNRL